MRAIVALMLMFGVARAAGEPDMLSLMPPGADCFARLDLAALGKWPYFAPLMELYPKQRKDMADVGLWPLADAQDVWWAIGTMPDKTPYGIVLFRGNVRMEALRQKLSKPPRRMRPADGPAWPKLEAAQLGPRLVAIAPAQWLNYATTVFADPSKMQTPSALERETRAQFSAQKGDFHGVCKPNAALRTRWRKQFPEASYATVWALAMHFKDGLILDGVSDFPSNDRAAAMLKKGLEYVERQKNSVLTRAARMQPFFVPLQLTRENARLRLRYHMDKTLMDRVLGVLVVLRNFEESSGDAVR